MQRTTGVPSRHSLPSTGSLAARSKLGSACKHSHRSCPGTGRSRLSPSGRSSHSSSSPPSRWLPVLAGAPYGLYCVLSLAVPAVATTSPWPLASIATLRTYFFPCFIVLGALPIGRVGHRLLLSLSAALIRSASCTTGRGVRSSHDAVPSTSAPAPLCPTSRRSATRSPKGRERRLTHLARGSSVAVQRVESRPYALLRQPAAGEAAFATPSPRFDVRGPRLRMMMRGSRQCSRSCAVSSSSGHPRRRCVRNQSRRRRFGWSHGDPKRPHRGSRTEARCKQGRRCLVQVGTPQSGCAVWTTGSSNRRPRVRGFHVPDRQPPART